MIQSGQFSNLSEILSMSTLAESQVPIKSERVMVITKSIRGFCSNQGNVTLRLMIQSGQNLNLFEFIDAQLICKFQEELVKTE